VSAFRSRPVAHRYHGSAAEPPCFPRLRSSYDTVSAAVMGGHLSLTFGYPLWPGALSVAQAGPVNVEQPMGCAQPQPTVAGGRHGGDPIGVQLVQIPARATYVWAAQAQ
jgi:hypothetical protein